jgi:predicted nucleic acid-binding protein
MTVLVDSNVLLDLTTRDPVWSAWSAKALTEASNTDTLVINAIIYAEISVGFDRVEEVDEVFPPRIFGRDQVPYEAAFLAGKVYRDYRRRGGTRRSPLPDFYVGAHAAVLGYRLLTRDAARYKSYFPTVELIAP